MAKRKKKYDDDDGRVIAPMNVDGMPWFSPGHTDAVSETKGEDEEQEKPEWYVEDKLTPEENRSIFFGAMRAGCLFGILMALTVTIAGIVAYLILGGFVK